MKNHMVRLSKNYILHFEIYLSIKVIIFFLPSLILFSCNTLKNYNMDDYNYALDYSIELNDMPVMTQETGYTCFLVSMAIVRNYFNLKTTEYSLLKELNILNNERGMLPSEYLSYANEAFKPLSYSVLLLNPRSEVVILNIITESLIKGLPAIFFYSSIDDWNKPNYNTHYSIIYGIDMSKQIIKISNPYGYLKELSFREFFMGLSFQNYKSKPFKFQLGRIVGHIKKNNIFLLDKD